MTSNPWGLHSLTPERAVLLALANDTLSVPALAAKAGIAESEALAALERLQQRQLAVRDEDGYELTGPLSWFGTFASAVAHYARRNFVVTAAGDPSLHLYVCDVRVKGARPTGDPLTETVGVLACGTTAREITLAQNGAVPSCGDCRAAATS